MSVTHAIKPTDLLDRLVDVPPTTQESAQILAFLLPRIADSSPAIEDTVYGQARREMSAALHFDLVEDFFLEAVELGHELTLRAAGFTGAGPFSDLSDERLAISFSFVIDRLLDGVNR